MSHLGEFGGANMLSDACGLYIADLDQQAEVDGHMSLDVGNPQGLDSCSGKLSPGLWESASC